MRSYAIDRLPPHALDMEQGVLGCQLISPNDCVGEVVDKLKFAGVEAHYDLRHQTIQSALFSMYDERKPIDVVTVMQWLKERGDLEKIGGITYLSQLQDAVPSAANLSYYLEKMLEKFLLRRMIQTCTEVVAKVYDYDGGGNTLLDEVERDILSIRPRDNTELRHMKELVNAAIDRIEKWYVRHESAIGVPTGFTDMDKMLGGLVPGNMILIAGRPSFGKTSLAMNIAENIVLESKLPVGFFSLEMTADELTTRTMCSNARVNLRAIREGFMAENDFPKLTNAAGRLINAKLYIDDTPGLSIMQLRARMRRMVQMFGIKIGMVDYLQLLHAESKRARENRQQEISDISNGIKALAKELKIPILVLSQMNRRIEQDKTRKPRLSDLRESGSLEQDSDVVGFLYRPSNTEEDVDESELDAVPVNLLIAKQRNGPTGDINLTFLKSYTRFESAAKVSDEDIPHER